jgi:hypothetical protein
MNVNQILQLPCEYIIAFWNNGKKEFKGFKCKWSRDKAESELEMLQVNGEQVIGVMRKIQLKGTGYIVIDIDQKTSYEKMIEVYPILADTLYVPGNTKGGHFYFKTEWKGKQDYVDCLDDLIGDIIVNQIFELEDKEWNNKTIQTITSSEMQSMVVFDKQHVFDEPEEIIEPVTIEYVNPIPIGEFERDILNNIDAKYYTSYMDWLKFIWAIRFSNFENALDIADEYSKRVQGYVSRDDVEKKMMDSRHEQIGWGYLMNLSKKSNSKQHTEINKKNKMNIKQNETKELQLKNDSIFDTMCKQFEITHCKILDNGFYVRDEDNIVTVLSEKTMKACYKHIQAGWSQMGVPISFIDRWLSCNNNIRSKKTIGIYPVNCPENAYNLWKPFEMELTTEWEEKSDAISIFKKHISVLCNHEKEVSDWFIRWIAQFIQFPEIKTTMPTFVSAQGAGKNTLLELIRKLIGNSRVFETTDPARDVFGSFNKQMANCFLVILSEISSNDMKNADGKIKGLITDPTLYINPKGVDQYPIDSYHRFITFTNNSEAIKPVKGDRRNVVIRCSDELCKIDANGIPKSETELQKINEYINRFRSILTDVDSQKTIYEYLKTLEVSDFHTEQPPKTEFHKLQAELTISPIEQFIRQFTLQHHDKNEVKLSSGSLYLQFKDWCAIYNKGYDCSSQQFGIRLKNLNVQGIEKGGHTKNGETKIFNIPILKQKFNITMVEKDVEEEEIGHQEL